MKLLERAIVPLSRQQKRLVGPDIGRPPSSALNVLAMRSLPQALTEADLRRAADRLMQRFPALRLTIEPVAGAWCQHLLDEDRAAETLSVTMEPMPAGGYLAGLRTECAKPIPFDGRPLWRFAGFAAGKRTALLILASHAILDGRSLEIVVEDLETALRGEEKPLAHALSFLDYCREPAPAESAETARFWQERLAADFAPPPRMKPVPNRTAPPERVRYCAGPLDGAAFASLAAALEVSSFSLHTALSLLTLCNLFGRKALPAMFFSSGRKRPELRQSVGCFYDPVLLPARFEPEETFEACTRHLAAAMRASLDHLDFDLARLIPLLGLAPPEGEGRMPLTTFSVNEAMSFAMPPVAGEYTYGGMTFAYDLMFVLYGRAEQGNLGLILDYRGDMFEPEELPPIAAEYFRLLRAADPAASLKSLLRTESLIARERFEMAG